MQQEIKSIIEAIRSWNGDTSRSAEETLNGLEEIQTEVDALADALKEQIED